MCFKMRLESCTNNPLDFLIQNTVKPFACLEHHPPAWKSLWTIVPLKTVVSNQINENTLDFAPRNLNLENVSTRNKCT